MPAALPTDITAADVVATCAEASKVDPQVLLVIVAYANEVTNDGVGGDLDGPTVRLARLYLAAHFAFVTVRAKNGAAGPVTSEAAGALRRSYGLMMSSAGTAGLGSTQFGQQYLSILSMSDAHGPFLA